MKKLKKVTLLILGILVASFTLFSSFASAGIKTGENIKDEQYQQAEKILAEIDMENNSEMRQENLYKIYNNDNRLVYETRNAEDQKLKILIIKSDLLTTINNISYYKLSR